MKKTFNIVLILILFVAIDIYAYDDYNKVSTNFSSPASQYYPETWFHFNGNNITKEGITLDLQAIKDAKLQGIHLFSKNGRPYPGIEQIKVLSPEWEEMVRHAADECQRLDLKFTMQNCPGWSMTGGPWVPVEEAQREIVESTYRFTGSQTIEENLELIAEYHTVDYDYKDVQLIAFPTPQGDIDGVQIPSTIESNNKIVPWAKLFDPSLSVDIANKNTSAELKEYKSKGIKKMDNGYTWVKVGFDKETTLRSIVLSPFRHMIMEKEYPCIDLSIKVEAKKNGELQELTTIKIPDGCWCDRQYNITLAIPETSSTEFVFTFIGKHSITPGIMHLSSQARIHNIETKAGKALRSLEKDVTISYTEQNIIPIEKVINLTSQMDNNGTLNWDVPEGEWTVVRFGHVNMRRTNKPAMPESTGWECSKLDKQAIENHLRNGMIGQMIKDGGPIGDGKLDGLLIDSWESFIPNWTMHSEDMFMEFEQRRGYSMKPYLPATMGYIVESSETTTKFLRDWRQTLDDVYIENFFNHFAKIAHEMGAEVYTEAAGGEVLPIDPMRYYGVSDNPMTEFWYPKAPSSQNVYSKPIYNAASATHLYNKPFLSAEACTQLGVKWNEHPFTVKYLIDFNFTKGVNHLVFHTFSHTPQREVFPGSSFGGSIGFPFVRQQTWWPYMPDFTNYLARCQYILQQGEYVADVLWYYGDHFERPPHDKDYFPEGYRFDYLNAEVLQEKLSVKDGVIKVKNGGNYRIISLRDSEYMMLSTARKLKELVLQGAVILGDKPQDSPSLMDDTKDVVALKAIAEELWGNTDSGVKSVGKGKVYWGLALDEVLEAENIAQDVKVPADLPISWIHRQTTDADYYFVSTTSEQPIDVSLSFRIQDASPQLWDPFTGRQKEAQVWNRDDNYTHVALSLVPVGSSILVFPRDGKNPTYTQVEKDGKILLSSQEGWYNMREVLSLAPFCFDGESISPATSGTYVLSLADGSSKSMNFETVVTSFNSDWDLAFSQGWDAPETYEMKFLSSLSEVEDPTISHYSGTITYSKEIIRPKKGKQFTLDLGEVHNIAELWCNGKKVGVRWAPPYHFDLTNVLTKGKNQIDVKVTNTWRNQLIFDNTRTKDNKLTWTTNPPKADEKILEKSGLVGPVLLHTLK